MDAGERLKQFRLTLKLTQPQIGEIIGKSAPTVQRYEAGTRKINKFIVSILQSKLGLNPNWLYTGKGSMMASGDEREGFTTIPIYDLEMPYNKWSSDKATVGYYKVSATIKAFDSLSFGNLFMAELTGDYMPSSLQKGDFIIADKDHDKTTGTYVCAINSRILTRKISFRETNAILMSEQNEPELLNYAEFEIIGRVIWIHRPVS